MNLTERLNLHSFFVGLANAVFSIIMLLLALRFVFRLFGASTSAPFINWLYGTTSEMLYPFRGIFPTPIIDGGFVLDLPVLIALIMYGLILSLIIYLFDVLFGVKTIERRVA